MSLSIIVLAAGKGSRMCSSKPKVFHEVGNYPMLFHVLDTAVSFKDCNINLVFSEELKKYKRLIKDRYKKIEFSIQVEQNGTADAVKTAIKFSKINSTISLVMYGDTPLVSKQTLKNAMEKFDSNNLDLCVISMKPEDKMNSYGKLKFRENKLIEIVEQGEIDPKENNIDICNSGIMVFKTNRLIENLKLIKNHNKKKEFYLTDLVKIFSDKQLNVDHFLCDYHETLGANSMIELAQINKVFQTKARNNFLSKGVTMHDPETIYFSYNTKIGKNVTIQPNVYFGPYVEIKDNVVIRSFSYLDNVKVFNNVTIGPFSRIRDEAEIKKNSKIGNFVEIKKSNIDENVKISHLSYIGDAIINKNSNIGAGAITCNYDGIRKNKTIIGENCFIGSNSSLVAPLNIKKGSTIGAGTVVNKDIPNETIVYRKSELIKKNKKK